MRIGCFCLFCFERYKKLMVTYEKLYSIQMKRMAENSIHYTQCKWKTRKLNTFVWCYFAAVQAASRKMWNLWANTEKKLRKKWAKNYNFQFTFCTLLFILSLTSATARNNVDVFLYVYGYMDSYGHIYSNCNL